MNILILSTPRTGSTFFCDVASKSGLFGNADSYWIGTGDGDAYDGATGHGAIVKRFWHNHTHYMNNHRGANGVVMAKIMWDYIETIERILGGAGAVAEWLDLWDAIIVQYRNDIIAQAVSWQMALASGYWHSNGNAKRDWPEYDSGVITYRINQIAACGMRGLLTAGYFDEGTSFLLEYEDATQHWQTALAQLATCLDIACNPKLANIEIIPRYEKLAEGSELKSEFIRRYKDECGAFDFDFGMDDIPLIRLGKT